MLRTIHETTPVVVSLSMCVLLAGCAPSIDSGHENEADDEAGVGDVGGPNVDHRILGDGVTETIVDASDATAWIYLDLETGEQVEVVDPERSDEWDLGFRRFMIKTNGGISGSGDMEAAALKGEHFESIAKAPPDGYVSDAEDGEDEDDDPDYALGAWYDYDPTTHVLTPVEQVYVVRSVERGYFKLELLDYYDDAGTSGFLTFMWAQVEAP